MAGTSAHGKPRLRRWLPGSPHKRMGCADTPRHALYPTDALYRCAKVFATLGLLVRAPWQRPGE